MPPKRTHQPDTDNSAGPSKRRIPPSPKSPVTPRKSASSARKGASTQVSPSTPRVKVPPGIVVEPARVYQTGITREQLREFHRMNREETVQGHVRAALVIGGLQMARAVQDSLEAMHKENDPQWNLFFLEKEKPEEKEQEEKEEEEKEMEDEVEKRKGKEKEKEGDDVEDTSELSSIDSE